MKEESEVKRTKSETVSESFISYLDAKRKSIIDPKPVTEQNEVQVLKLENEKLVLQLQIHQLRDGNEKLWNDNQKLVLENDELKQLLKAREEE